MIDSIYHIKIPLSKRPKIGFQDHLSLNAGQKYCRLLHSAKVMIFIKLPFVIRNFVIPPANFACGGYTVFTFSVRACVRPSVTLCFLNIFKSHCLIFIKPCKHVHICKTNTLNKKVRARGQFYWSYFPL